MIQHFITTRTRKLKKVKARSWLSVPRPVFPIGVSVTSQQAVNRILNKLDVSDRTQAVIVAVKRGIVSL
jgi:hypothetical protein